MGRAGRRSETDRIDGGPDERAGVSARAAQMNSLRGFLVDLVQYIPAKLVPYVVGLVTLPVLAHLFSPAEYGDYVLVTTVVSLIVVLGSSWLITSVVRFLPRYQLTGALGEFYTTIWALALTSLATLGCLSLAVLLLGAAHLPRGLVSLAYLGVALFVVSVCFEVLQAILNAKRAGGWYSAVAAWRSVAGPLLGIALALLWRRSVSSLVIGQLLSIGVVLPLMLRLVWGDGRWRGAPSMPLAKEVVAYGFPMVAGLLAYWFVNSSDRYIIGLFRSSHEVGVYSLGYNISGGVISSISAVFFLASGPVAMSLFERHGLESGKSFLTQFTRLYAIVALPTTVALGALGKPMLRVLASAGYLDGYRVIPLIAFAAFLGGVLHGFELPLAYLKKTQVLMACTILSAVLTVGLNLLTVPRYGYMGAAATTIVSYGIAYVPLVVVSRRYLVWRFPFVELLKVSCASAVMGIVMYYVASSASGALVPALLLAACTGTATYVVALLSLRGLRRAELLEGFRVLTSGRHAHEVVAVQDTLRSPGPAV